MQFTLILFADDCDLNATPVWIAAVFEHKNPLPGAELQFAVHDWNRLAGSGQHHPNVRRHVVWAFVVVFVAGVFGNEFVEKPFDITTRCRGCIFHGGQAATGVSDKNGDDSILDAGLIDLSLNIMSNLVGSLSVRGHFNFAVMYPHF